MAQNVNPTPSASSGFDKDAAERGSATSSAQVSPIFFISLAPEILKCLKKFREFKNRANYLQKIPRKMLKYLKKFRQIKDVFMKNER